MPYGDAVQPGVGLRTAEGQQPGQSFGYGVAEDRIAGEGVGIGQEVEQGGHDGLLVGDLMGGQTPACRYELPGAVDELVPELLRAVGLAGCVQAAAHGERRRGQADGQVGGAAEFEAAFKDAGGEVEVVVPAVGAVPVVEEAGRPRGVVEPGPGVPGLGAAARGGGLVEWAERVAGHPEAEDLCAALREVPMVTYAEDLPILRRYWRTIFGKQLTARAAVTVSNLYAVLSAVNAGAD